MPLYAGKNRSKFCEISQSGAEFSTVSRVFTDQLSNSPKRLPQAQFSPGCEGTKNIFYFLNESKVFVRCNLHDNCLKYR